MINVLKQLPPTDKKYLSALWGKLASEILMQNWEHAMDDLNRVKEFIDSNVRHRRQMKIIKFKNTFL